MSKKNSIKLFEDKLVRSVWDDEKEEWYFSVNDVVQLLTDTTNINSYLKTLRNRDEELSKGWLQIVPPPFCSDCRWNAENKFCRYKRYIPNNSVNSIQKSRN